MIGSKIGLGRGSRFTASTLTLTPATGTTGPVLDVTMAGAGAGAASLAGRITRTATAGAGNIGGLDIYLSGTLDATAAQRNATSMYVESIATRSAGANLMTNTGIAIYAAGGQINTALVTYGGDVSLADGGKLGFHGTAPIAKQTGVAVTAAAIHAALVALGLIAA